MFAWRQEKLPLIEVDEGFAQLTSFKFLQMYLFYFKAYLYSIANKPKQ